MPDDPVIEALPLDALSPVNDSDPLVRPAGKAALPGSMPPPPGQAPLPGSITPPAKLAPLPGSVPQPAPVSTPAMVKVAPAPVVPAALDPAALEPVALDPVELQQVVEAPKVDSPDPESARPKADPPIKKAAAAPAPVLSAKAKAAPAATRESGSGSTQKTSISSVKLQDIGEDPGCAGKKREALEDKYLGPALKKHVDPASPPKMRMLAAQAMVPMPPRDQVHVLYQLTLDEHPKIAAAAAGSLAKLPENIVGAVAADTSSAPQVLGLLAETLIENDALCEKILLNRVCPDSAYVWIAEYSGSEKNIEIVANNQQRLLREHDIVRSLKRNEITLKSTLERVVDFMVRNGVLLRDLSEFSDSFSKLNQRELEEVIADIDVPFAMLAPEEQARLKAIGKAPAVAEEFDLDDLPDLEQLDEELALDDLDMLSAVEEMEGDQGSGEEKKISGIELVRTLNIPQQVKLAMVGNKEVRSLLLRSTVRMVAEAAVRSPRITDMEVINVASSRAVQDSVIRLIATNREWTRLYQVKMALVNNPKTPLALSMNFLRSLRLHDLKMVSKSKNVPSALMMQAKRIAKQKAGG